ncbi:hypothetical protein, conserved [Eimeria brunetti]|uniref:Transmembrane protein n=1 Tax=Eimeria brunetti TaxID=51314 RepID=U6LNL5_9EIME|nr:hypothetical protein, conserved [Eimeria brunetti]
MEDPTAVLKGKKDKPAITASKEYDNLYQLELKYWSIKTLRKTVRYTGCLALTGQLVAALFSLIAAPWADTGEKNQKLKFTGCVMLSTFSASCLLLSLAAVGVAWVTSVKARVGNALLFAGFHIKSLLYSSCACAISAALLKCIGIQIAPLSLGATIAGTCLVLLQLLMQPVPLGGFWAVCVSAFLLFLVGSQRLLSALAEGALPKGIFAFAGFSHLLWVLPLITAAALAAVLLLCHFLELLLAVSRGGYQIFCPPNPHLYSLDDLANDAAQGRPLSLSPCKPRSPPSVAAVTQLFREKLSPRLQGPAIAQQRRTVGGPASAASRPGAADQKPVVTSRTLSEDSSRQKKASCEGAWLVALWLRGPFFLASLGAFCIALSVGIYAITSDSEVAFHGKRGPAAFGEVSRLLLPTHRLPMQHVEVSFVTLQEPKPTGGGDTPLIRNFLQHKQQQQQEGVLFAANHHRQWKARSPHMFRALQAPTLPPVDFRRDTFRSTSADDPNAEESLGSSFLHIRRPNDPWGEEEHHHGGMKSAAALLLLALVLVTPLFATSFGEWIEDIFFAHMVLIKRNPWMIVPPPTVVLHQQTPMLEPAKATEAAPPSTDSSDPLLHVAQERMTHQTPQNFLGLDRQPMQEEEPEQESTRQPQHEHHQL